MQGPPLVEQGVPTKQLHELQQILTERLLAKQHLTDTVQAGELEKEIGLLMSAMELIISSEKQKELREEREREEREREREHEKYIAQLQYTKHEAESVWWTWRHVGTVIIIANFMVNIAVGLMMYLDLRTAETFLSMVAGMLRTLLGAVTLLKIKNLLLADE